MLKKGFLLTKRIVKLNQWIKLLVLGWEWCRINQMTFLKNTVIGSESVSNYKFICWKIMGSSYLGFSVQ